MSSVRKLIFVIPWYGKYATGGAETLCKTLAEHLKSSGFQIEIFTTCSRKFQSDWKNDYETGTYHENGLIVKRFKVNPRDGNLFNSINAKILSSIPISENEELEFFKNNINSSDMMRAIKNDSDSLFIFIPYLYGTTFFGSQIHPKRSMMIPCLHDEGYAKMNLMKKLISEVGALSFNSYAERDFAASLIQKLPYNTVCGTGIDPPLYPPNPMRFKQKYDLSDFILYAGRKEDGKNVPLLIEYFCKFLEENNTNLKLVLTGSGTIDIPKNFSNNILNIFLQREELYDAYSAATLLCLPSLHESFSIVIMESWINKTPVLVHNQCKVTKDFCLKSNGGLFFDNYDEFEGCVKYLLENKEMCKQLGENGAKYVLENFNWNKIISSYSDFFKRLGYVGQIATN